MEKSNYHNVNRNTSNFCRQQNKKSEKIFNNIRGIVGKNNLVTPEILVSEIWMREGTKSGVEIIEINSSNSETEEPLEEPTCPEQATPFAHAWSYINNRFPDDPEYKINNRAREKWRKNHEELAHVNDHLHHDTQMNFNGIHYIDNSQVSGMQHTPQANCFTIINNNVIDSDSSISSEQEYAKEEIESFYVDNSTNPQNTYWDHVYKDDSVSYDPTNPDKRTVWIYSFKNQRRLSENDFEIVDIPISGDSDGTSTSNSLTDEEQDAEKGTYVNRISSPIPPTYLPRLDLSMAQTLSTVTELSELKSNESLVKKPINNWLTERVIPKPKKEIPDVVNWMSLSPRERRRRFKNTTIDSSPGSPFIKEYTYAEGNTPKKSAVIQVDAEVHATDDVSKKRPADLDVCSIQSGDFVPQVKDMETNENSVNVSYADADLDIDSENIDREFDECAKPCINLTTNKTYNVITDPIEKLNSDYWIGDVKVPATPFDSLVQPTETYLRTEMRDNESCMNDDVSDSVNRRLWLKRTKLMKSPLWDQYFPITGTPLSLHLSMSLSSIESKKSWFRCIGKYLNCCR